jgi:hypothetical protein
MQLLFLTQLSIHDKLIYKHNLTNAVKIWLFSIFDLEIAHCQLYFLGICWRLIFWDLTTIFWTSIVDYSDLYQFFSIFNFFVGKLRFFISCGSAIIINFFHNSFCTAWAPSFWWSHLSRHKFVAQCWVSWLKKIYISNL